MNREMLISSYFPLYRSPPHPAETIDWNTCDDDLVGYTQSPYRTFEDTDFNPVTGRFLEQVFYRYIKQHPDVLIFDQEAWLKCYTTMRISHLSNSWGFHSSRLGNILLGCVADFSAGPDDLLAFNYMQISVRLKVADMLTLILKNRARFYNHLHKRWKDKRYKYLHRKEYKSVKYWLNPEHWAGFQGGFILDFFMCEMLNRAAKSTCLRFPIRATPESGFYDVVKVDPALLSIFNTDETFIKFVAKLLMGMKPKPVYWAISTTPLDPNLDAYITYMLEKKRKEMAEHGQSDPAEGQQGALSQEDREALNRMLQEGTIQEIRVPDFPDYPVADTAPAPDTVGAPVVAGRGIQIVHNDYPNFYRVADGDREGIGIMARPPELATVIGTATATEETDDDRLRRLFPSLQQAIEEGERQYTPGAIIRDSDGMRYDSIEEARANNHPIVRPSLQGEFEAYTLGEWTLQALNNAIARGRGTAGITDQPPAELHGVDIMPDEQDLIF